MMKLFLSALFVLIAQPIARADTLVPAGQLQIEGVPVACGGTPTLITQNFGDTAFFDGRLIMLDQSRFFSLPINAKLFIYAHECAHAIGQRDESGADCWAIRTGKLQGWFPPAAFQQLIAIFQNSPGDWTHLPGPQRLEFMARCYSQP